MYRSYSSCIFSLFFIIILLFTFPTTIPVKAQGKDPIFPWNLELRAGVALPTGDFAETVNLGTDLGLKVGYSVRERFMIRGDIEPELYSGSEGFESTQLWHYSAGLEYMFTDKGITEWRFSTFAGLGASTITFDNATNLSETYFSMNYGAKFGRGINDNLDWFVSVMGRTVFANSSDNTNAGVFTTIPVTVGLNYRFNLSDKPIIDKMEQPPN